MWSKTSLSLPLAAIQGVLRVPEVLVKVWREACLVLCLSHAADGVTLVRSKAMRGDKGKVRVHAGVYFMLM